jgi:hypothetical protein
MRFPPFEAALRQPDGSWRLFTPPQPLLTAWRLRVLGAFAIAALLLLPLAIWGAGRLVAPFRRLAAAAGDERSVAAAIVGGPPEARQAARALDACGRG